MPLVIRTLRIADLCMTGPWHAACSIGNSFGGRNGPLDMVGLAGANGASRVSPTATKLEREDGLEIEGQAGDRSTPRISDRADTQRAVVKVAGGDGAHHIVTIDGAEPEGAQHARGDTGVRRG